MGAYRQREEVALKKAELIAVAKRWLQAGFSVIPVRADKVAVGKWGERQINPYELHELEAAFNRPGVERIAVITGYGGLLCFDFDPDKHNRVLKPFSILDDFFTPW